MYTHVVKNDTRVLEQKKASCPPKCINTSVNLFESISTLAWGKQTTKINIFLTWSAFRVLYYEGYQNLKNLPSIAGIDSVLLSDDSGYS